MKKKRNKNRVVERRNLEVRVLQKGKRIFQMKTHTQLNPLMNPYKI